LEVLSGWALIVIFVRGLKMPPAKVIKRYIEERGRVAAAAAAGSSFKDFNGQKDDMTSPGLSHSLQLADDEAAAADAVAADSGVNIEKEAAGSPSRRLPTNSGGFSRPWESPARTAASPARSSPRQRRRTPSPTKKAKLGNVQQTEAEGEREGQGGPKLCEATAAAAEVTPRRHIESPQRRKNKARKQLLETADHEEEEEEDEEDRPLKASCKSAAATALSNATSMPKSKVVQKKVTSKAKKSGVRKSSPNNEPLGRKAAAKAAAALKVKRRKPQDKDFKVASVSPGGVGGARETREERVGEGRTMGGVRTRRSAGKAELEHNLSMSKEWWCCVLCKASVYYGTKASKDHFKAVHGLAVSEDEALDTQQKLYDFCLNQGFIMPGCVLCGDEEYKGLSYSELMSHYAVHHKLTSFLMPADDVTSSDVTVRNDIQPPADLETLVSIAYAEMFGSDAPYVNNEACSFVAEEFAATGFNWMTTEETDSEFESCKDGQEEEEDSSTLAMMRVTIANQEMRIFCFNEEDEKEDEDNFFYHNGGCSEADDVSTKEIAVRVFDSRLVWTFNMPRVIRFKFGGSFPAKAAAAAAASPLLPPPVLVSASGSDSPVSGCSSTDSRDRNENLKEVKSEEDYLQTVASLTDGDRYLRLGFPLENFPHARIHWLDQHRQRQDQLWISYRNRPKVSLLEFYAQPPLLAQVWLDHLVRSQQL